MTNILYARLSETNNILPARNIAKNRNQSQLVIPSDIYEYSMNKTLKEKSDFKKDVRYAMYEEKSKKKKSSLKTLVIGAFALIVAFILGCKISK